MYLAQRVRPSMSGSRRKIWTEPNADFCIILSTDRFLILKSWDRNDKGVMRYPPSLGMQPERQSGLVTETYDSVKINLRTYPGKVLNTPDEIIEATLLDQVLVGRVAFTLQDRYTGSIDFPVKTMNANEREAIYQTDTGPILFPDLTLAHG